MKTLSLTCVLGLMFGVVLAQADEPKKEEKKAATVTNEVAVIKTTAGEMVIEFWPDVAPKTVENFKTLAKKGFYDGTAFHRIIKGFMIQGGDPLTKDESQSSKWGTGGPGYNIKGETNNRNDRKHVRGVISMAHSGHPDTAGSQFYICLVPTPQLDGGYTTFGKLIKGDDVLTKLGDTPCGPGNRGENSRPINRAGVESVKIVPADSVK
ncbi:MAG: peptidylprolyl isomerase [Verrucomicrobia bacterium]|nr:peptidylprolyl isomerase [Verrucomicrobiota bacterium]